MRRDLVNHVDLAFGLFEYFANDVIRIREALGISQEEFDEKLNLKPGSTALIETIAQLSLPDHMTLRAVISYADEERGIAGKNYCNACGVNVDFHG